MAELAHQLTMSPTRLREEQILGIETLLGIVEPEKAYPYELVCFHITKYRKRGPSAEASIPGKALVSDLVTFAEFLSRKSRISAVGLSEPFKTHQETAEELQVSTKTVRRWRDRGLMGIRVVCEDGVSRLAFFQRTIDRFIRQNQDLVNKGASFKQLTDGERLGIVDRARTIVAKRRVKMHAAARMISEETGRAVETVRYTLRRFDEANPQEAVFVGAEEVVHSEQELAICRCHEAGELSSSIARAFDCTPEEVESTLRRVQWHQWKQSTPACIFNQLFDAPNADAMILDVPEPPADAATKVRIPNDLPAYLQSLYRTPLFSREQEQDLFRRYNYLKYKTATLLNSIDVDDLTCEQFDKVASLTVSTNKVKQRIIKANLRLVVSIAKKHVGWSSHFFEVISDGNISLMRAVEKFDYSLGNKFSTYASWAIIKNYARSIPEEQYRTARFVTGREELLESSATMESEWVAQSDRQRVRELIDAGIGQLDEREQEIVRGHFGLNSSNAPQTLEKLGQKFGVTKERIRQIELRAMSRLREVLSPSLVEALGD